MGADILMEPEILMFSYGLREVGACEIGAESGVPEASFHFFGYCIITSKDSIQREQQNDEIILLLYMRAHIYGAKISRL